MATDQNDATDRMSRLAILATRAFTESGLHGIDAEVVIALDVAHTMAPMYLNGSVQELVESLMALALRFDDDGVVPTWTFGQAARYVGELRADDHAHWVARNVASAVTDLESNTLYAPLIEALGRRYFPREWSLGPTEIKVGGALKRTVREWPSLIDRRPFAILVIVVTGGDCADATESIRAMQRASRLPIFFQFAGISPPGIPRPEFAFLKRLDRLGDRWVDNAGFFEPRDYTDPNELFHGLLNEFPTYLQEPRVLEMLLPPVAPDELPAKVPAALTLAGLSIPDHDEDDPDEISPAEVERLERERLERQRRREQRARDNEAAAPAPEVDAEAPGRSDPLADSSADPLADLLADLLADRSAEAGAFLATQPPPTAPPPIPPVPMIAPQGGVDPAAGQRRVSPPTRPYQRAVGSLPTPPPRRGTLTAPPSPPREAPAPSPQREAPASRALATDPAPGAPPARVMRPTPAPLPPRAAAPVPAPPRPAPSERPAAPLAPPPRTPPPPPPPPRTAAPAIEPPPDDADPAIRLARIRARRAARQVARGGDPDDDPTIT